MPTKTLPPLAQSIARAKREVIEDVLAGKVPHDVRSFSDLHDWIDANEYGGMCEAWYDGCCACERFTAYWNEVQDAVHDWIVSGAMVREAAEEESRRDDECDYCHYVSNQ